MNFIYKNKEYILLYLTVSGSRLYEIHYEKNEHPLNPEYVSDYDYKGVILQNIKSNNKNKRT